jgi:hypothetical protein
MSVACASPKIVQGPCATYKKSWAILGFDSRHNISREGCYFFTSLTICFLMCDVRLNVGIIQHTYTSFTSIAHHGAWLFKS